jgi:hypothetical protein
VDECLVDEAWERQRVPLLLVVVVAA